MSLRYDTDADGDWYDGGEYVEACDDCGGTGRTCLGDYCGTCNGAGTVDL